MAGDQESEGIMPEWVLSCELKEELRLCAPEAYEDLFGDAAASPPEKPATGKGARETARRDVPPGVLDPRLEAALNSLCGDNGDGDADDGGSSPDHGLVDSDNEGMADPVKFGWASTNRGSQCTFIRCGRSPG